ncbi:hypothetical protein RvY_11996 [Ramazzottius varieornatus]|uniref:Uncharacterized protein n=1 Tax=Ramazzottius varieornatus TaxID=947166 RepID=A0A1D1VHX7_RAMVA|nr:hypothetical protein RvY_11996 [Ramazzottius varieornatus]
MDNLRYLDQMLRGKTEDYQPLVDYMKKLFRTLYPDPVSSVRLWNTATWVDDINESQYTKLLLDNAVIENACFYDHPQCVAETKERFTVWRVSGTQLSSPLLGKSVDGTVRDQDKNSIFSYISRWEAGAVKAWEFIQKEENWSRLARKYVFPLGLRRRKRG